MARLLRILVLSGAVALLVGTEAGRAIRPPAGIPDLSKMALQVSDLPAGAKVERQGYVRTSEVAEYEREFKEGTVRVGSTRLLGLQSTITLMGSANKAWWAFEQLRDSVATKRGRQALAKELVKEAGGVTGLVRRVTVGPPTSLDIGDDSLRVPITVGTALGDFRVVLAAHSVGPVISLVFLMGGLGAKLPANAATTIAQPISQHMHDGLIPINTVLPTVTGVAQAGETLSATAGTWTNTPEAFAYQWQRCDAAGANCSPITDATAVTYVLAAVDIGSTIRVEVEAANTVASTTATSVQTAVVAA